MYKTKKKRYRGKGHAKKINRTFSILLTNIRGIKSKKKSLEKVVKHIKPSIIVLNETQLQGNAKVQLASYTSWSRNRREQEKGGGVATCVSREYKDSVVGIGEGSGDDEFLITRLEKFRPALTIVNCYGEQRKTTKEEVVAKWNRLRKELEAIRMRTDFCVLAGDLNKLVGCDDLGVPGNNPDLSKGGKLLRELLATKDWVLVNSLGADVVEGGPYTRVDPATSKLSCLDLFIVSRELRPHVKNLFIDSKRKWKIARSIRNHGRVKGVKPTFKLIYSDHFPVLLTLTGLPKVEERKEEKEIRWNLAREGGWENYEILSNHSENKLKEVVANEEISIEEVKDKFDKVHDKVCFKAFGKVTIFKGSRQNTKVKDNAKENKPEEEVAKNLQEDEDKRAAEEIEEIKNQEK